VRSILLSFVLLALAACQREAPAPAAPVAPPAPAVMRPVTTPPQGDHAFDAAITPGDFAWHVQKLASDEFEGRAPGSLGERLTKGYLQEQFERIGIRPGNGSSYLQSVPMLSVVTTPETRLSFKQGEETVALRLGEDFVLSSRGGKADVAAPASAAVFVGYGISAPDQGWDDYANVDVKGKVVVVLINDPGLATNDPTVFKGATLTYPGRWTYKFEEAARRGALGCLIVHDTPGAAYGWDVVRSSWGGERHFLPRDQVAGPPLEFEGWLSGEAAAKLLGAAGEDLAALRKAAATRGFQARPLSAPIDVDLRTTLRYSRSDNVIGVLPGTTQPDQAVVVMAHWDHLGRHDGEAGDNIYNGARDNASGVAGVLELAEAYARQQPAPARSMVFLLPTLEESMLLGSQYYVEHPTVPIEQTVAAINLDDLPIRGRTRDMLVIGHGESELDDLLAEAAKAQGRVVGPDLGSLLSGFYFRSDHFNFARRGVPVLYARSGIDQVNGGPDAGKAEEAEYVKNRYHKPTDQFSPDWDLSGVMLDLAALQQVGRRLGSGEFTPRLKPGAEFSR